MKKDKITFTNPQVSDFTMLGLGKHKVCAAVKNGKEFLYLIGDDKFPYMPAGGRKVLKHIIDTCEEGVTYYWK